MSLRNMQNRAPDHHLELSLGDPDGDGTGGGPFFPARDVRSRLPIPAPLNSAQFGGVLVGEGASLSLEFRGRTFSLVGVTFTFNINRRVLVDELAETLHDSSIRPTGHQPWLSPGQGLGKTRFANAYLRNHNVFPGCVHCAIYPNGTVKVSSMKSDRCEAVSDAFIAALSALAVVSTRTILLRLEADSTPAPICRDNIRTVVIKLGYNTGFVMKAYAKMAPSLQESLLRNFKLDTFDETDLSKESVKSLGTKLKKGNVSIIFHPSGSVQATGGKFCGGLPDVAHALDAFVTWAEEHRAELQGSSEVDTGMSTRALKRARRSVSKARADSDGE